MCHKCDNPPCVNPDHLFIGTPAENSADMVAKGRSSTGDRNPSRTRPERLKRGESVNTAKLTSADVLSIRSRYARGERLAALARAYGVTSVNIAAIVRRETWKHI